ncbi:MAG TPA: FkbM family methyltransferase [Candidatus Saccharimonadales bacterium]|nr:FkbM family methyltransferase [Candidatus Saccharimonadales bacterium]
MLDSFNWTNVAKERIAILAKYEPLQPYMLMELTKSVGAEIFLDIGANIGAYSVIMASIDCIKAVHAFEPTPLTFSELSANIGLNSNASKVTVHPIALSDSEKVASLGIVSDFSGANSIVGTSIHEVDKFTNQLEVKCLPLDSVLTIQQKTLSIKIDVEGHELQALAGSGGLLTKNRAIIQIENYNPSDPALSDILTRFGYRMLFHVGPDEYFSNIPSLNETEIIAAFSRASTNMISANFSKDAATNGRPIRVQFPLGIAVELSGSTAGLARKARQSLRRPQN